VNFISTYGEMKKNTPAGMVDRQIAKKALPTERSQLSGGRKFTEAREIPTGSRPVPRQLTGLYDPRLSQSTGALWPRNRS
jgi:hypothetical protein